MSTLLVAILASANAVAAWEFRPTPICTLSSIQDAITVDVTYDATLPEYAIHLTRTAGWAPAPVFSLSFEGGMSLMISTDRHVIEGTTLTVRDRGFGNVLKGLAQNTTAIAILGEQRHVIDLTGASPAVAAFDNCPGDLSV